ncbi:MAG: hypothetical protein GY839_16595 [candidate division Zixibacteria bacterium]|nr:hypothetical protein [candidate division Zixibacteria bacterium]
MTRQDEISKVVSRLDDAARQFGQSEVTGDPNHYKLSCSTKAIIAFVKRKLHLKRSRPEFNAF